MSSIKLNKTNIFRALALLGVGAVTLKMIFLKISFNNRLPQTIHDELPQTIYDTLPQTIDDTLPQAFYDDLPLSDVGALITDTTEELIVPITKAALSGFLEIFGSKMIKKCQKFSN